VSAPEAPRRMTLSHVIERLTEPRNPAPRVPTFEVSQVKAVGGAVVFEWSASIPVCDEYPTAEKAFAAAKRYAGELRKLYPPPPHEQNGGKK